MLELINTGDYENCTCDHNVVLAQSSKLKEGENNYLIIKLILQYRSRRVDLWELRSKALQVINGFLSLFTKI